MRNKIIIESPLIEKNRITYSYTLEGPWKEAFTDNTFFIEYSCDISSVPEGLAIVPLLGNILPVSWIYDAEIFVHTCDKDFYESVPNFKKGYEEMYPMIDFKGALSSTNLQENRPMQSNNVGAFFSGGADAFNTLVCHINESPTLITLWGADVKPDNSEGWGKVLAHLNDTTQKFNLANVVIKSTFRQFTKEAILCKKIVSSGDNWWHGFQHGLGIISHAAPIAYLKGFSKIYFASSFTAADKGKVTCASDPTIDNFIRFSNTEIIHDGYEFTRQMKIHNITTYAKTEHQDIPLRVCWESSTGSNCCKCEKCFRTILAIYAEGHNPRNYGFDYSDSQLTTTSYKMRFGNNPMFSALRYTAIQNAMKKNCTKKSLPFGIRWFYDTDISKLDKTNLIKFIYRAFRKIKRIMKGKK